MKKQDLQIPEPCDASWEQMRGDQKSRFCSHCTKDVHNLSMLSKDEAAKLLEETGRNLCVQYVHNNEGQIMFRDDKEPSWRLFSQKQGLKLLLSAAALAVPMLLGACDEPAQPDPTEAVATSPIKLEEGKAAALELTTPKAEQIGAGRAPTFQSQPTTQPEPYEVLGGEPMPVQDNEPKPACDGDKTGDGGKEEYLMEQGELEEPQEPTTKIEEQKVEPAKHYEVLGGKPMPPVKKTRKPKKEKPKEYKVVQGDLF